MPAFGSYPCNLFCCVPARLNENGSFDNLVYKSFCCVPKLPNCCVVLVTGAVVFPNDKLDNIWLAAVFVLSKILGGLGATVPGIVGVKV